MCFENIKQSKNKFGFFLISTLPRPALRKTYHQLATKQPLAQAGDVAGH
jgi:hypothetical protein